MNINEQILALIPCFISGICGFSLGWERQSREKAAGIRTHLMVSLGSCLFTLASVYMSHMAMSPTGAQPDPARLAAQIVSGIGFLGGGVILRDSDRVKGLTTASTIWLSAALGVLCGIHLYVLAIVATTLALIFLAIGRHASHVLRASMYSWEINLAILEEHADIKQLQSAILDVIERKRNIYILNHYIEKNHIKILLNYTGSTVSLSNSIKQLIPPTIEYSLSIETVPKLEYHDELAGYDID